jgi:hypothetical protein
MRRFTGTVVVWLAVSGLVVFGLSGCGKKPPSEPTQTKSTVGGGTGGTGTGGGRGPMMKGGPGGAATGPGATKGR